MGTFERLVSGDQDKLVDEPASKAKTDEGVRPVANLAAPPSLGKRDRPAWIVLGLFLGYAYYNTLRGAFPIQMRKIASDLNIPVDRIGLPNSAFSAAYGVGKFFGSILTDYLPCAECHTLGIVLCGLNVAGVGLCRGISSIAAVWSLQGALQAFGWPFLSRVLLDKLPKDQCAKYWGLLSMAGNVGNMVAPYGTVLATRLGMSWRSTLRSFGAISALVALVVHTMLRRGGASGSSQRPAASLTDSAGADQVKKPMAQEPKMSLAASMATVFRSPALWAIFLCNSLSFGSSKCMKEWGAMYLRGTGVASSDLQSATLLFWAEIGGSLGAALSGVISSKLGGRHALTCLLSAWLGFVSTGLLTLRSYRWNGQGSGPMPFVVACALQACSLAGINGVRTLAGLHLAEVAKHAGSQLGLANGFGELIGQIGSVLSGLPVGAIVARATASATASGSAEHAARVGWAAVPALLTAACGGMAVLNLALLPQEKRRLQPSLKGSAGEDEDEDVQGVPNKLKGA